MDRATSELARLLKLWYAEHGGPTPLYRMDEQAAWLVDAGVLDSYCQELRQAAEQLVRLGNQPGLDDEEWEDAFSALEQALGGGA